jgi:hypothetical protein
VGCAPNGPAMYFRVLGRFCLETFLRSTCLGWLCQTLCSYARYLDVSTLLSFKIDVTPTTSSSTISTTTEDFFTRLTFQDPVGYPRILDIIDLRPLEVGMPTMPPRGRPCQTPCSHAWRFGCLYTSFDEDHDSVFFSFLEHQTSHVVCFNARGLLYECVFDALLFSSLYRPVGKPVSHHIVTQPTFSSSYFLDHHTNHLARHDAQILLMSASPMPSEFFHRRFDLLEVCFL